MKEIIFEPDYEGCLRRLLQINNNVNQGFRNIDMNWIRNKIRKYADKGTNHRSSCYSKIASFSDANSVNVQIWISSEYK